MRVTHLASLLSLLLLGLVMPATARAAAPFPAVIDLPTGFRPEGIAIAPGGTFFVGSIPTGNIYRGDLRTGAGAILVVAPSGRSAIGLAVDPRGRLFVAGGMTGDAYVYDQRTGEALAVYELAPSGSATFINDVVVTQTGAYFTDSRNAVLYVVPIAADGTLGSQADVQTLPLTGDYQHVPDAFNVNGIDATPDGKTLILVQSNTGFLFTVDAETGVARKIDLGGETVRFGDGILLQGRTLYVVQNQLNRVAVIELAPDLSSGTITGYLTDSDLAVPTTIAGFGDRLYTVNARFGIPDPGTAAYQVVQLR